MRLAGSIERLREANASVIAVSFESPDRVVRLKDRLQVPVTFVVDPDRDAYEAFGLSRASWSRTYLHHEVVAFYTRSLLRGHFPDLHRGQDRRQLGGDFVIDPNGIIVLAHPERGPEDRADVAEIVRAAEHDGRDRT